SKRQLESVALHVTCTSRKLGLEKPMLELAQRCAKEVIVPEEKGCCGFAGDKGFTTPELNASALKRLRQQIPEGCELGVSNSRTCEAGLSHHSGIPYQSIVYLVDQCHEGIT
ncbi:MAG: (Fe-S)-binding protein, partial [Sedimenticola sp.]